MSPAPNPNEIHMTRLYDAPLDQVWDSRTDFFDTREAHPSASLHSSGKGVE